MTALSIMKKLILIFFCLFAVTAFAKMVDRIVAKVGDDVITLSDVAHAIAVQRSYLAQKYGKKQGVEEFSKFKDSVIEEMVLQKVLDAEIKKLDIQITSEQVEQEHRARLGQYGMTEAALIAQLRDQGIALFDYKENIKLELEQTALIQKKILPGIGISDYDLQKEYEQRKNEFLKYQKQRFIQAYFTADKFKNSEELMSVAQTVQSKLKQDILISDTIKKYSSGPFADQGGDSGLVETASFRPEIQNILLRLKVGETSPLIPLGQGVIVIKLLAQSDPQPLSFNEVMPTLRMQYGEKVVKDELRKYLLSIRDQMYIEIVK